MTIQGLQTTSPRITPPLDIRVGVLRRQIPAELALIESQMAGFSDPMTERIRSWMEGFSAALASRADEEWVCNQYFGLLKDLLRDPLGGTLEGALLDETAILASDDRAYGNRSFEYYRANVGAEFRDRSPLVHNLEIPFRIKSPHLVVQQAARFLKKFRPTFFPSPPPVVPSPPTAREMRNARLSAILGNAIQAQARVDDELQAFQRQLDAARVTHRTMLDERVGRLMAETQNYAARTNARLDGVEEEHRRQIGQMQQAVEQLNQNVVTLRQQVSQLKEQNQKLDQEVKEEKAEVMRLQQKIEEVRLSIEEENASQMGALLITIVIIGACLATTAIAMSATAAVSSSAQVAAVPMAGGASAGVGSAKAVVGGMISTGSAFPAAGAGHGAWLALSIPF